MRSLLDPSALPQIPAYAGMVFAITLLGWAIGGMIGRALADYIGRRRTMILAIITYSIMTGLTALAFDWRSFAMLRFLVGIAIGSEWVTGASMVAEFWPDRARGKGAGPMQSGICIGFFIASLTWLFVGQLGADAWRRPCGVAPTLNGARRSSTSAAARRYPRRTGPSPASRSPTCSRRRRFGGTYSSPSSCRSPHAGVVEHLDLGAPLYLRGGGQGRADGPAMDHYAGLAFNFGALFGQVGFGFFADGFGRKPVTLIYFAMALAMTPVLFLSTSDPLSLLFVAAVNAFFCQGLFSWMPTWLPELFPTHSRATAMAFTFNMPRIIAFLGPLLAGTLIVKFGGYGYNAMIISCIYILGFAATFFLPETRGKSLPDIG